MSGRRRAAFISAVVVALLWALAGCSVTATALRPTAGSRATSPSVASRNPGPASPTRATAATPAANSTASTRQPASPTPSLPADFAFTFASDHCGDRDELDTFAARFTRHIAYNGDTTTVTLTLTISELTRVYQRMVAIAFFDYPATISPTSLVRVGPPSVYEFAVRHDGRTKRVHWMTGNLTPTATETQLAGLVAVVEEIIHARPEVQRLPRGFGCT